MKKAWLTGPVLFALLLGVLLVTWAILPPGTLIAAFDNHGRSPVELATIPVFLAIVPMVWWKCPFAGSRTRQVTLCVMVTIVALMAVAKELDLHQAVLHFCYPQYVGENGSLIPGQLYKPNGSALVGTPFKARVLTNVAVPFGMKALILFYFAAFFGVFAAGFAYLGWTWVKGVFRLNPAAWAWGCFGGAGVLVQMTDRLPAWLGHGYGLDKSAEGGPTKIASLCTCLEEGGEMMIAVFALLTIYLGWRSLHDDDNAAH